MLTVQVAKLIKRIYLCQFLGQSLVLWHSKKQNLAILSTAKAEYIVAKACCPQILWINQQPRDLRLDYKKIFIKYDNQSALNITKNLV